jgi:type II secretory pathway predicted ATPase ExeA
MIQSHFGITHAPFSLDEQPLLEAQKDILENLRVHSHQRGFCVVAGSPGTGKTVLRKAFAQSGDRRVCPHITRTMHTYPNTLRILCASLAIEYEGGDLKCEKQVIEQAHALHRQGKAIALTIDDAHLMPPQHLRKLRLLLEDTPGNYGIVLFAQTELLAGLALAVNEDLRSRISYSALLRPLTPEDIEAFILREFDRSGLAHSRLDTAALHLIATSSNGILRHSIHLTTASLIQAVRSQSSTVTTAHVNTALMQPHWREHEHWITHHDDEK